MSFVDTKHNFDKIERDFTKQEIRPTTYSIIDNLFQLNSYTDDEHLKSGHASQTIQFDTEGLKDFLNILNREFPDLTPNAKTVEIKKILVPLLDKNNKPQYGLNWGQRINREPNQAYIQLPIEVYRSDFFPKKPEHFFVHTDDGLDIKFTRAQKTDEGTALQTPDDNSYFGKYIRDRLGIPHGQEITAKDILNYGCTEITFFKINDKYYMDFSKGTPIAEKSANFIVNNSLLPFDLSSFSSSPIALRYTASLLAKPFAILTGNSGTGKTRIATQLASWLKKDAPNGISNSLVVPVGADWTDNTKILGYFNPLANEGTGDFIKSDILNFIELAKDNQKIPFFLILDEMNLSHVERYFSDFLSAMESGKPILLYKKPENCESTVEETITLPKNLFVTGTVNIDETTYMFSPKVLDRANVIEFIPEKDDILKIFRQKPDIQEIQPAPDGMAEAFVELSKKVRNFENGPLTDDGADLDGIFGDLYDILKPAGFEFAYRTTKEIVLYYCAAKSLNSELSTFEIIDHQIVQKILPKIHGNKKQIGDLLNKLKEMLSKYEELKLSQTKVSSMLDKLEKYQYASFI
ncbi:MAG: NgoFVII family restriction endonuclease [Treponema sp.]|nr:NgoFVII family restriction endonuclease [Treponema sp.]